MYKRQGLPQRAEAAVLQTIRYNVVFMLAVSAVFFTMGNGLVSFFTQEAAVMAVARQALFVMATCFVFYGMGMVLVSTFNGAGDTRTPTGINFAGFWLFQVPFSYLLARFFGLGPLGVFIAIPVAETAITAAAFVLFRQGRWKQVKV